MSTIVAVHCAGRSTGIVRRAGNTLTGWWLFSHVAYSLPAYARAVIDRLVVLVERGDRLALVALPSPAVLLGHGASYGVVRRAVLLGALLSSPGWAPLLAPPRPVRLLAAWRLRGRAGRPARAPWRRPVACLPRRLGPGGERPGRQPAAG